VALLEGSGTGEGAGNVTVTFVSPGLLVLFVPPVLLKRLIDVMLVTMTSEVLRH